MLKISMAVKPPGAVEFAIGHLTIANVTEIAHDTKVADYDVVLAAGSWNKTGKVIGFERSRGAWHLLVEALAAIGIVTEKET